MSKRPRSPAPPSPAVPPAGPQLREVTPEMRARTQRTFILILVGFFALIGMMVASLSVQGRAVRDYGQEVLSDVRAQKAWGSTGNSQDCSAVSSRQMPAGLLGCTVERNGEGYTVVLSVEGDRQYRLQSR